MDTVTLEIQDDPVVSAPGMRLDVVITESIPYGPGRPGYEWVTDRLVLIHPSAYVELRSRLGIDGRADIPDRITAHAWL